VERTKRWKSIPAASRSIIKNTVLSTLNSPSAGSRNIASLAVQCIAFLDFNPEDDDTEHWLDLLPNLVSMMLNEAANIGVRTSCAQTVGYVFEVLDEYDESPLDQVLVINVLQALLTILAQSSQELQLGAMKALLHSLVFLSEVFGNETDPNLKSLRNAIFEATMVMSTRPGIAKYAQDAMAKIAEYYYPQLEPHMPRLAELTASLAMGSDSVSVLSPPP